MSPLGSSSLSIILLILRINLLLSVSGCPDLEYSNSIPGEFAAFNTTVKPKMALTTEQPRRHDQVKYFHQLKPNVALVNMTGILTLRLDCWAPYPIDLQFTGHLTNQETTVKTFRKEFGPSDGPHTCFIINATMESYEEITGNYSCVSVQNPTLFSSYYIFVSLNPPGVLLTRGQKLSIQLKPEDTKVVFPCAVSHPDVGVQLLKDTVDPIPLSRDLTYDPKVGFTMKVDARDNSIFRSYSCQTELSPNDSVNITLLAPKKFEVYPPVRHIRLKPNEHLSVTCDAVQDFFISIHPPTLPFLRNEVNLINQDVPDEEVLFYKYHGVFESDLLPQNTSGFVACIWKASNQAFAEWSFSVLESEPVKPGHLDVSKFKTECPKNSEIIMYECSNIVECKINSCRRKDSKCQSNGHICRSDKSCIRSGLVQCPSAPVSEIFFTGFPHPPSSNKTNRYVNWEHADEEELLILEEVFMPYAMTATQAKFSCQGSNFVFSSGFKWFLIHRNGTRSALSAVKGNRMNISVSNSWKEKKSNLESTLTLPLTSDLENDITNIECSAPIWNSWKWISRRIPIDARKFMLRASRRSPKGNSATSAFPVFSIWKVFLTFVMMMSIFGTSLTTT